MIWTPWRRHITATRLVFYANSEQSAGTWNRTPGRWNVFRKVARNVIVVLDEAYTESRLKTGDVPTALDYLTHILTLWYPGTFSSLCWLLWCRLWICQSAMADDE